MWEVSGQRFWGIRQGSSRVFGQVELQDGMVNQLVCLGAFVKALNVEEQAFYQAAGDI
jgi:hypothetical protein